MDRDRTLVQVGVQNHQLGVALYPNFSESIPHNADPICLTLLCEQSKSLNKGLWQKYKVSLYRLNGCHFLACNSLLDGNCGLITAYLSNL